VGATVDVVRRLDHGTFPIQGPPKLARDSGVDPQGQAGCGDIEFAQGNRQSADGGGGAGALGRGRAEGYQENHKWRGSRRSSDRDDHGQQRQAAQIHAVLVQHIKREIHQLRLIRAARPHLGHKFVKVRGTPRIDQYQLTIEDGRPRGQPGVGARTRKGTGV
jgi:hypothetical protein